MPKALAKISHIYYHLWLADFNEILDMIFSNKASVNFYMFHGGTNWGFMNGANVMDVTPFYAPDVSSYGKNKDVIHKLSPW